MVRVNVETGAMVQVWNPRSSEVVEAHPVAAIPLNAIRFEGDLVVADGEVLLDPRLIAANLQGPEGLAVADEGALYVVEAGVGRLSRVETASGEVSIVADGLALGAPGTPSTPPTWIFNGVAVGPSGIIYVTGDVENKIYRIQPAR